MASTHPTGASYSYSAHLFHGLSFHWGCGGLGAQLRLGLALLLGLQELHAGLVLRGRHPLGGGLDIEGS